MSLVEQELLTIPEHLISPPVFSGVPVTRSLVLYVCFVDRCLSFCTFSFGHCVVCPSSMYRCWLPLWYLQTLPKIGEYNQLFRNCFCPINDKKSLKTPKLQSEDVSRIRAYTIMAKGLQNKHWSTKHYKANYRAKRRILKTGVNSGSRKGSVVPAPQSSYNPDSHRQLKTRESENHIGNKSAIS